VKTCSNSRQGRRSIVTTGNISLTIPKAITKFRLVHYFPVKPETTSATLAATSGLGETPVRKLIRHAIAAQNLFAEARPGVIAHSTASRLLAEDEALHSWVDYATHDL
jgi:hypothetical protein